MLKESSRGSLFGRDKRSFVLDQNINEAREFLSGLVRSESTSHECAHFALKIILQLGKVRQNPEDYLTVVSLLQESK